MRNIKSRYHYRGELEVTQRHKSLFLISKTCLHSMMVTLSASKIYYVLLQSRYFIISNKR